MTIYMRLALVQSMGFSTGAGFSVAYVGYGYVYSNGSHYCYSYTDYAYVEDSEPIPARPIVSLGSEVQLNKK